MSVSAATRSPAAAKATISQMFSTPVAQISCPYAEEWNARLARLALEGEESTALDFGYKHESPDLSRWGAPAPELTRWVGRMCRQLVEKLTGRSLAEAYAASRGREGGNAGGAEVGVTASRSWASVYRRGDRHEAHFHPNTAWSAIYYVSAPGVCELDLLDPRPHISYFDPGIALAGEDQRIRLRCAPGDLVIFPGWLRHAVPVFDDDAARISLSWNLNYAVARR